MFAIARGLLRAFGILPVLVMVAIVWVLVDRAAQERNALQENSVEVVADEDECFGAYTSATADGFDIPVARITSVKRNSPAQIAGLQPGDVITAENGLPLQSRRLWQREPLSGQGVALSVARPSDGGGYQDLRIILILGQCSLMPEQPT